MEEASRARMARGKESAKTAGVGRQSKLVGPVLRATRRHRGLPTEKCHDRVLHVSGLCSTVREPGEAGRRGTR